MREYETTPGPGDNEQADRSSQRERLLRLLRLQHLELGENETEEQLDFVDVQQDS